MLINLTDGRKCGSALYIVGTISDTGTSDELAIPRFWTFFIRVDFYPPFSQLVPLFDCRPKFPKKNEA